MNLLKQEDFLGGAVTTDFILKRPDLFKVERGQNRAQKLLQYLGNVMVNGPCTPLATGLKPSKDAPDAPEVRVWIYRSRVNVVSDDKLSTLSQRLSQVNMAGQCICHVSFGGPSHVPKHPRVRAEVQIHGLD